MPQWLHAPTALQTDKQTSESHRAFLFVQSTFRRIVVHATNAAASEKAAAKLLVLHPKRLFFLLAMHRQISCATLFLMMPKAVNVRPANWAQCFSWRCFFWPSPSCLLSSPAPACGPPV